MGNSSYSLKEIIIVILAFIGTVIAMSFRCLGIGVQYIGGSLFFLYMLIVFLPILILFNFKRFIENPKKFVK